MIQAIGCRKKNVLILTVSGHAGQAEKGRDIVCAGASALVQALAATLRLMEAPALQLDLADGEARISCRSSSATVHALFYQTLVGLILMQQEHPAHIHVNTAGFFADDREPKEEIA